MDVRTWIWFQWQRAVLQVQLEARTLVFWAALLCAGLDGIEFAVVLAGD